LPTISNLISYVFSLPGVYKIHNGWSKYLLRQAMAGLVPDEITARTDKVGFNTPEYYWLHELKDQLLPAMWSPGLDDFVDYRKLSADWEDVLGRQSKWGITAIWRYINFALWKKRFGL